MSQILIDDDTIEIQYLVHVLYSTPRHNELGYKKIIFLK